MQLTQAQTRPLAASKTSQTVRVASRCAAPRQARRHVAAAATAEAAYQAPSTATAASELAALSRVSSIVPDTLMLESAGGVQPKAATVSSLLLSWVLSNEQLGMRPYQNAIEASLAFDGCRALSGDARASCQLDKALTNVGALLAGTVEGRVCTEIDPRLANDKDAMVAKARALLELYAEDGVPRSKLIFRVPATWAGIQAAAALEREGVATQAFHIYSLVQGAAAAQAGVSIVQPNVGRTRDWYRKHPGVIRDPHGPREDSGCGSGVDPGVRLAADVYNYVHKRHAGKTAVMASGLRSKADALALAGCDYLVLPSSVMGELAAAPTLQGYNSGLSAAAGSRDDDDAADGVERALSPTSAAASELADLGPIDEARFNEGLGLAGRELLKNGLDGLVRDVETVLPFFRARATGME